MLDRLPSATEMRGLAELSEHIAKRLATTTEEHHASVIFNELLAYDWCFTYDEAAHFMSLSAKTIYRIAKQPGFPVVKVGRSVRIPRRPFQAWLDSLPRGQ